MPAINGSKHHAAKLTEKDVRRIRASYAKKPSRTFASETAKQYGVTRFTIYAVLTGRSWKHV